MGVSSVVKIGHSVLREKAKRVPSALIATRDFKKLVNHMIKVMRRSEGVGLAANQIGLGIQLIVLECQKNKRYPKAESFPLEVWINPSIVKKSKNKTLDWEGCLSIPGYRGRVGRHRWVIFKAMGLNQKIIRKKVSGFHARVVQHEIDHLNGSFYVDRMKSLKTWMHVDELARLLKIRIEDR